MVIKTELVVSSIKNAIFESRKSGGTPIERFIKRYTFIDTRFQTSVGETRFISSQASYFFFLFFFYETSGQASKHSCFHHYRGGERFWPRSVAFEAREKRSDPTTRVSTLNLFSPLFFFSPVLEREWNLRGNLCLVFFLFSFFFSFDFHGTKADGCSIGQGIYDVFEHSSISRHVARRHYILLWPIGRHMTRTLQLQIATCLRHSLSLSFWRYWNSSPYSSYYFHYVSPKNLILTHLACEIILGRR